MDTSIRDQGIDHQALAQLRENDRFPSAWNPRRLWLYALDGIFSFSVLPLKVWTLLGLVISLLSLIYAFYRLTITLVFGIDVPGWTTLVVAQAGFGARAAQNRLRGLAALLHRFSPSGFWRRDRRCCEQSEPTKAAEQKSACHCWGVRDISKLERKSL